MLRALRPFFEIIIYTYKTKNEAEMIVSELEKDEQFFSYIIPHPYCIDYKHENVFVKEIDIFYGNRSPKELAVIST